MESYQPICFHQGYCNLNEDLWREVGGGAGWRARIRHFTLSRVVFVGSNLVLHSTCWYKGKYSIKCLMLLEIIMQDEDINSCMSFIITV